MKAAFAIGLALAMSCDCAKAAEPAPFFQGKTINMVINFSAGGPTDTEGRLVARHLPEHIPGNPTIIARNMGGAGGAIGINYVGRVAPADGLTFVYSTGVAFDAALKEPSLKVDLTEMPFIAAGPGTTVVYIRSDYGGGIHQPADILTKSDFWVAGLSPDSQKDVSLRMQMDLLGLKYHYLTGYPGTADIRLAIQRNEAQMTAESMPAYRASVEPLVKKGEITPLWYDLGNSAATGPAPDVQGIPATSFVDFYKTHGKNDTHSELYRTFLLANEIGTDFERMMMMPPGSPREAVDALKQAFAALGDDPAFRADAINTIQYVPRFAQGEQVERSLREALKLDDQSVDFLHRYIDEGESANKH
jgi:tripartite-type tricarboxylate transporter receptor subunit TctC